jgi:putative ABC transport system permease protein
LQEIDSGFVGGLRSPLAARATNFGSDAEVWSAIVSQHGYAVVAGSAVTARHPAPGPQTGLRLAGVFQGEERFDPFELWVRDDRGGTPARLIVIGVMDPRVSFPAGIYTSQPSLQTAGSRPPDRASYYLKARPDGDPATLALGINISLPDSGVRASAVGEDVRRIQSVRVLLNELLQGFFGIGLLAGLAALGVISMRAVVERRHQIGVLRALGFRRQMVRLSLLLETSLLAVLGIGIGVCLGLALAGRLIEYIGLQNPEITFGVPWGQISLIASGAYLAALALTALPLWQIGRIEPADALRYEE